MPDTQTIIDGFVDDEAPPAIVVGRSESERYANCPHQAFLMEHGAASSGAEPAIVGNEVHAVLSAAVRAWHTEELRFAEVRDRVADGTLASRPDVQPAVIDATNAYRLAGLICDGEGGPRHHADAIRYDGGEGPYSGQITADFLEATAARGPVRITGELDFLTATPSVEEVDYLDWKSGWRHWTASDVERSYQFQFYALLIFLTYPQVNRFRVRVVETRTGQTTAPVVFTRERHQRAIHARVRSAVELLLQYRDAEGPEDVPAWPAPAKCATCDAACACLMAFVPDAGVAKDPEGFLKRYVVVAEQESRMKAALSTYVRGRGEDLVVPGVAAFGVNKPKATRAPACDLYTPGTREK